MNIENVEALTGNDENVDDQRTNPVDNEERTNDAEVEIQSQIDEADGSTKDETPLPDDSQIEHAAELSPAEAVAPEEVKINHNCPNCNRPYRDHAGTKVCPQCGNLAPKE